MTSSKYKSIYDRINSLSESHQLLLAKRLQLAASSSEADTLAAFVVTAPGTDIEALKDSIKESLPDYMQPEIIPVDGLPRTPNGKVDRKKLQQMEAKPSGATRPADNRISETQLKLINIWQNVLGVGTIRIEDNFFELGGDSIRAMQVISRARAEGIQLSVRQLFAQPTIAALSPEEVSVPKAPQETVVSGELILSPIQQWFFRENFAERDHWNQSALISLSASDSPEVVEQALKQLAEHHEALRLYFNVDEDQVWQTIDAEIPVSLQIQNVVSSEDMDEKVQLAQKQLDISTPGGAWKAVYLKDDNHKTSPNRLLMVFHHLLVDGVSWSVLLEDLSQILHGIRSGSKQALLPRSVTLPEWHNALSRLANQRETFETVTKWLKSNAQSSGEIGLKGNVDRTGNTEGNSQRVVLELTEKETSRLQKEGKSVFRSSLNEILLATLFQTLQPWTKQSNFRLNMEGHGREEGFGKDASRAVGWFTSFFPLSVTLNNTGLAGAISAVKQALAELPLNGLAVSAAQYLSRSEKLRNAIDELMCNDVLYNYLGKLDAEYGNRMEYKLISSRSPLAHRSHLLEVTAYILNDRLQLQWDYCPDLHDADTIEKLANEQLVYLLNLLNGESQAETEYIPSDFPLANLDGESLEKVASLLAEIDAGEELS